MASEKDLNVYVLGRTYDILHKKNLQDLTSKEQQELSQGLKLLLKYYEPIFEKPFDHRITGLDEFFRLKPYREILELKDYFFKFDIPIINFKKKKDNSDENKDDKENDNLDSQNNSDEETTKAEPPEKVSPPKKEDSTVPAELETLVATYKASQTDKLDEETVHTVADAVKRARKAWEAKNRVNTILKNRTEQQKEAADNFFIEKVDPKSESKRAIYKNVENIARQAITVQATKLGIGLKDESIVKAIEDLTYLGLAGAVDFTNFIELNIVSELVFKIEGKNITPELNNIDNVVQAWQHELKINPYSDSPDKLEKEIISTSNVVQVHLKTETEKFEETLKKNYTDPTDLQSDILLAKKQIERVQTALIKAIPFATLPHTTTPAAEVITPIQAKELEKVLRQSDPTIQINPEGSGARTVAVLQITNSGNRNISPEAVRLYALGIYPVKLDNIRNDPNSELSKLIAVHPEFQDVFQQVRFHIGKIHESELGKEIQTNIKLNPVSGFTAQITNLYNKLPPSVQTATKFILNPKGTVYAWANKRIGEAIGKTLVKNVGSATAQKLGNFILKEGLQKGVATFAKAAAEKVALEVAKKIGVVVVGESLVATVAVALGISTAGASLLIGAILIVATEIVKVTLGQFKKGLDVVWQQLGWGDEFKSRDLIIPAVVVGSAAVGAGTALLGTLAITWRATQIAISSAIGIIIGAIVFSLFYLLMAFLVSPILSTLVQLDSKEKVDYSAYSLVASSSGECGWPTKGHYIIVTGPNGGTHYRSKLEAIDIGAPNASPLLASTDGVVTFTGVYSNYGNTTIIQTKNSAGSFAVYYAHQSSIGVHVGQQIKKGSQIGLVGGSGGWSPHIHMEYKGIKYNQCPAGGLKIKEGCCIPYTGGICTGLCNAYSN